MFYNVFQWLCNKSVFLYITCKSFPDLNYFYLPTQFLMPSILTLHNCYRNICRLLEWICTFLKCPFFPFYPNKYNHPFKVSPKGNFKEKFPLACQAKESFLYTHKASYLSLLEQYQITFIKQWVSYRNKALVQTANNSLGTIFKFEPLSKTHTHTYTYSYAHLHTQIQFTIKLSWCSLTKMLYMVYLSGL